MLSAVLPGLSATVLRRSALAVSPAARAAASLSRTQSPVFASPTARWKHCRRSGSEDGDSADSLDRTSADTDGSAVKLTSPEFVNELKEEMEVLKNEIAVIDASGNIAGPPPRPASPTKVDDTNTVGASSADMLSFLIALRSQDDAHKASLAGIKAEQSRDIHMQFPLTPVDHPLLADDFATLPPYAPPPSADKINPSDIGSDILAVPSNSTSNQSSSNQSDEMNSSHPLYGFILGPRKAADGSIKSPPARVLSKDDKDALQLAANMLNRAVQQLDRAQVMYMTSVLRKRRKKMNKHKLRKLRKRTRSQRK